MPAPVRPASSQVPASSFDPKFQDQRSSPLATPLTSAHRSPKGLPWEQQHDDSELIQHFDFVDWSSKWPQYFKRFRSLADDLIYFQFMSRRECNALFWQGVHPKDRTMLYPHIVDRRSLRKPGADFNIQELFYRVHAILSQWRREDEAERQRKLEEDRELEQLILGMWDRSPYDPTYAVLYRQCA